MGHLSRVSDYHFIIVLVVNMAVTSDVRDILDLETSQDEFITKDALFNTDQKNKVTSNPIEACVTKTCLLSRIFVIVIPKEGPFTPVIMLNTQYLRSSRHIYFSISKACLKPRPFLNVIKVRMCEQNNGQLLSGKVLS